MKALSAKSRSKVRSFRDLAVWQKSMQLAAAVYQFTRDFPREEAFGLTSQLRRSAVSVPSNIAEGFGRMNRREFRHFLLIARGSVCELQTQLELAHGLRMGISEALRLCEGLSEEIAKMLFALLDSMKSPDS